MKQYLHEKIYDKLYDLIKDPLYTDGENPLPREIDLAETYGTSRETIRKAIANLVNEGLIYRRKHAGTYVYNDEFKVKTQLRRLSGFHDDNNNSGRATKIFKNSISVIRANTFFVDVFKCSGDSKIVELSRIMGTESRGREYLSISYFNPCFECFFSNHFMGFEWDSLYKFIKGNGIKLLKSEETISAVRLTDQTADALSISDLSTPVLKRDRFVYADNDVLVEKNVSYYNADKVKYDLVLDTSEEIDFERS